MSPATTLVCLLGFAQPVDAPTDAPAVATPSADDVPDPTVAPPPAPAATPPASSDPPPDDELESADPAATAVDDAADGDAAPGAPPPPSAAAPRPQTPLPPAPDPADPGTLSTGPWRGRAWVTLRIDAVVPVGGQRPARGTLFSAAGGIWAGYRATNYIGVFGGLTTFLHDVETVVDSDLATGEEFETTTFGRLTLVDLAVVRLWWPTQGRVQPFVDVGGFVGRYRAPNSGSGAVAGGRFGAGLDAWLGPTFSLNFSLDERLIALHRTIGHTLQFGFGATLHW